MWDIFDGCLSFLPADCGRSKSGAMWSASLQILGDCESPFIEAVAVDVNDAEKTTEIGTYRVEIDIRSLYTDRRVLYGLMGEKMSTCLNGGAGGRC